MTKTEFSKAIDAAKKYYIYPSKLNPLNYSFMCYSISLAADYGKISNVAALEARSIIKAWIEEKSNPENISFGGLAKTLGVAWNDDFVDWCLQEIENTLED